MEQKVFLALGMNLELRPCVSSSIGSVILIDLSCFRGWTKVGQARCYLASVER